MHTIIEKCFANGMGLSETLAIINPAVDQRVVIEYWKILEMERAIEMARPYFDRLNQLIIEYNLVA